MLQTLKETRNNITLGTKKSQLKDGKGVMDVP